MSTIDKIGLIVSGAGILAAIETNNWLMAIWCLGWAYFYGWVKP